MSKHPNSWSGMCDRLISHDRDASSQRRVGLETPIMRKVHSYVSESKIKLDRRLFPELGNSPP